MQTYVCNNRSHNALLLIFMFGKYRVHIWMNILVTIGFFRRRIPICKCTLCIFFTQKVFLKYYLCCWCWPSMSLSRKMSLFWRHCTRCSKFWRKKKSSFNKKKLDPSPYKPADRRIFFFIQKNVLHIFFMFRALCNSP